MLWFGHQWSRERSELGEGVEDLTLKKKLLPLMIAFLVISNHLEVIHLWQPQKWPVL